MQNTEVQILEARVSKWSILPFIFSRKMIFLLVITVISIFLSNLESFMVFVAVVLGLFYVFIMILQFYLISSRFYVLTSQRVMEKNRSNIDSRYVPLKQIASVAISRRGILAKLFNYGHISISTTGSYQFRGIYDINNPQKFSEAINKAMNKL